MPTSTRSGRWLVGVAIVLLAINLRPAVGSVGVVLDALRGDLGMSVTTAGLLTTLPVLCFAAAGIAAHSVIAKLGLHVTTVLVLVLTIIGVVVRSLVDSPALFLVFSVVALSGCAIGNILLPPLAKRHFPHHLAGISAAYGAALMGGGAIASVSTVPLSSALGDWRWGTAAWAIPALLALLLWLPYLRESVHVDPLANTHFKLRDLASSRVAWAMALLFGVQSAQAYAQFGWLPAILVDAGLSDSYAGAMVGLLGAVGVPLTLSLPFLMRRIGDRAWLPWAFSAVTVCGWLGLMFWPDNAPWLWAILLGLGGGAFTWTLTMIGRRARTAGGTAALSSFVQGTGFAVSAIGPFGTGLLHELTDDWYASLSLMIALAVLIAVFGTIVARPAYVEDTLRA
ncbi:MAG: MFS transporter [Aeromicrobium sp.]